MSGKKALMLKTASPQKSGEKKVHRDWRKHYEEAMCDH